MSLSRTGSAAAARAVGVGLGDDAGAGAGLAIEAAGAHGRDAVHELGLADRAQYLPDPRRNVAAVEELEDRLRRPVSAAMIDWI